MKRFERPTDWILRYIKTTFFIIGNVQRQHVMCRVSMLTHINGMCRVSMLTQYVRPALGG